MFHACNMHEKCPKFLHVSCMKHETCMYSRYHTMHGTCMFHAHGWKITLVGSRFTHASESRYAPIEDEALAVADALDKARHFVLGCRNLTIAVDHEPLLKIFGDRSLDHISNARCAWKRHPRSTWSSTPTKAYLDTQGCRTGWLQPQESFNELWKTC